MTEDLLFAESVDRSRAIEDADDARREQQYAEAEQAARFALIKFEAYDVLALVTLHNGELYSPDFRTLKAFADDQGVPALLRVLATALEAQ